MTNQDPYFLMCDPGDWFREQEWKDHEWPKEKPVTVDVQCPDCGGDAQISLHSEWENQTDVVDCARCGCIYKVNIGIKVQVEVKRIGGKHGT